jgi:hypothetical protein
MSIKKRVIGIKKPIILKIMSSVIVNHPIRPIITRDIEINAKFLLKKILFISRFIMESK